LRKKEGAAIHRTMGSLAFVAAARAAWIICKDPVDPNKRLFLPIKNNLAPDVTGLAFTIETSPDGRTPVISWLPSAENVTADMVVGSARSAGRPDDERQHAINWLQERLANGARPVRDLKQESDAHGISYYTLRRAFRALGGQAVRQGTFPFTPWYWKLPGIGDQNTGGEFWSPIGFHDDLAELFKQWMPTPEEKAQPHAASQAAQ